MEKPNIDKCMLVDSANIFFQAKHVSDYRMDLWTKIGFMLHMSISIVNKAYKAFDVDQVVFAAEGRSWRKAFYEPYKQNRTTKKDEESETIWQAYQDFIKFLDEFTNIIVLHCDIAEADDLIARWIHIHPDKEHVIVSSDSDFIQLLSDNVKQYNAVKNRTVSLDGVFDDDGNMLEEAPNPEWELFQKCVRGDTTDNVFSAYPGARKKGTSNRVGLLEAFEDRDTKGYDWNNFMLQRWIDHNGEEHKVINDFNRNRILVDLAAQPDEVKEYIDRTIEEQSNVERKQGIGFNFLKFCKKYELNKLADNPKIYADWMAKCLPDLQK